MALFFEHCRLTDNKIEYLGRDSLFEKKVDKSWGEKSAWDHLENEGWELVSVVMVKDQPVFYFKRQLAPGSRS